MRQQFKVGDLAITQCARYFDWLDGHIAVITQGLHNSSPVDMSTMQYLSERSVYSIRVLEAEDLTLVAEPYQLRPLQDQDSNHKRKRRQKPIRAQSKSKSGCTQTIS